MVDAQHIGNEPEPTLLPQQPWVRQRGRASRGVLASATGAQIGTMPMPGHAMAPRVRSGDMFEVDLAHTRISQDDVYVFEGTDGRTIVRRVQRVAAGSSWLLLCHNPVHPTELVSRDSVRELGRVNFAWCGRPD